MASKTQDSLEQDVDALFKLPVSEFTDARNALAGRLKKDGRGGDATLVKALTRPSISAWAVNQLYWKHRAAFDRLIATGQQFRQAQKSLVAGKTADVRGSLDARRESLAELSDLATALLQDAGHNPNLDTVRRITTTLEALSAYASLADGPSPGRLTQDIDPPGFDSLASLLAGSSTVKAKPVLRLVTPSAKSGAVTKAPSKSATASDEQRARRLAEARQSTIAAAKLTLQDAKKSLSEKRGKVQRLEPAQKKALIEAKQAEAEMKRAEKQLRQAEERFEQARMASEYAARRAQNVSAEADRAAGDLEAARQALAEASKELELLLR
jgi:hypothetical protein